MENAKKKMFNGIPNAEQLERNPVLHLDGMLHRTTKKDIHVKMLH
jgi:hypothetical protein